MAMEPEDRPKPRPGIVIGEDLALLSVEELDERVVTLESEIERIKATVRSKRASRDQAASVFKF